jgi:hypothetical protein
VARFSLTRPAGVTGPLTPEERTILAEGLPGRLFGVDRLERAATKPQEFNRAFESTLPRAMFVLLPVFALLTRLFWGRSLPRYPAHLYFALHMHSAVFGAMLLFTLGVGILASDAAAAVVQVAFLVYAGWYNLTALHRVFGDSWPRTIVKSVAIAMAYMICFLAVGMLLLLYAVSRM